MKYLNGTLLPIIFILAVNICNAADPGWSVNPSSYQYTMNITGTMNYDCKERKDAANKVAAFVGTECRGVVNTDNIIGNHYEAYLIVYSNTISGETISFKMYDAVKDEVFDVPATLPFEDNSVYGDAQTPYQFNNTNYPTSISLSSTSVLEDAPVGELVGTFKAKDKDNNETFDFSLVSGTGSKDNNVFAIENPELHTAQKLDFTANPSYSIRVRVTDSKGCYLEQNFTIKNIYNGSDLVDSEPASFTNYISPNGDGINDKIEVQPLQYYKDFALTIFNANYSMIYHVDADYQNDFEGKVDGKLLPVGAYFYEFKNNKSGKTKRGVLHINY